MVAIGVGLMGAPRLLALTGDAGLSPKLRDNSARPSAISRNPACRCSSSERMWNS